MKKIVICALAATISCPLISMEGKDYEITPYEASETHNVSQGYSVVDIQKDSAPNTWNIIFSSQEDGEKVSNILKNSFKELTIASGGKDLIITGMPENKEMVFDRGEETLKFEQFLNAVWPHLSTFSRGKDLIIGNGTVI